MNQCANAFRSGAANGGPHADLLALFNKLARLLRAPVEVLFVFDGHERPAVKRGRKVHTKPHSLTAELQWLLQCFGFTWYTVSPCQYKCTCAHIIISQARAEAEAELAYLNKFGHIDTILSEDVDTFIFGAKRVIRYV